MALQQIGVGADDSFSIASVCFLLDR